jgi:hypothetical protein
MTQVVYIFRDIASSQQTAEKKTRNILVIYATDIEILRGTFFECENVFSFSDFYSYA